MIISGRHAAHTERELRGYRWFWPGPPPPPAPVLFRDFAFHGPFSVLGLRLRGNNSAGVLPGMKGTMAVPFDCTISYYTVLADQDGDIVFDIYKSRAATYPPAKAQSICSISAERPHLSGNKLFIDRRLAGWLTVLKANDLLSIEVISALHVSSVTLSLFVTRNNQP